MSGLKYWLLSVLFFIFQITLATLQRIFDLVLNETLAISYLIGFFFGDEKRSNSDWILYLKQNIIKINSILKYRCGFNPEPRFWT
jgi:hypothetical protein